MSDTPSTEQTIQVLSISKAARMKAAYSNMFVNRLRNPEKVFEQFTAEYIRGINDCDGSTVKPRISRGYV
jgi:hypothetical protein